MPHSDSRTYYAVGALLICVSGAVLRLSWLLSNPVAFGRDGYYYALQLDTLRHGELAIQSMAVVPLGMLAIVRAAVGDDVLTIKLLSVAASFVLTCGTALFAQSVTTRWESGLLAALATTTASLHNLFVVEFLNNAIGMALFVWFTVFAVWMSKAPPRLRPWFRMACCLCAVAAAFSHASAGVAVMIVVTGHLAFAAWSRRMVWAEFAGAGLVAAILVVLFVTGNLLKMTAATVLLPSLDLWNHISGAYSVLLWMMVLFVGVTLASRLRGAEDRDMWGPSAGLVLGVLLVGVLYAANPFFMYEHTPQNIVDRLGLWGWLICSATVPAIAFESRVLTPFVLVRGVVLITGLLLAGSTRGIPLGADPRFLAARAQLLSALESLPLDTLQGTTVIAAHGDQFVVSYVTGADARSKKPSRHSKPVLWMLKTWKKDAKWPERTLRLGQYGLVPDEHLSSWLAKASKEEKREIAAANPYHVGWEVMRLSVRSVQTSAESQSPSASER